jgi:electron transport complex protein RnfG
MTAVAEPSYRKRIGYQAGLLGGFTTLAAVLLILGNDSTHEAIAERQAEDLLESLAQVLPERLHDNKLLDNVIQIEDAQGSPVTIYRAMKQARFTGFAFRATGQGYAGDIELILAVKPDGELLGVRVLSHAETPGLGDKIEVERDDWIRGFDGHSLRNTPASAWAVRKDGGQFDAFSGATITPRGVVKAVHESLTFFAAHQNELVVMGDDSETATTADEVNR